MSRFHKGCDMSLFSGCFNMDSALVSLSFLLVAAVATHRHPSLITLRSAYDYPSGGRRPTQIPQLDTSQASKESHNSTHNHRGQPFPRAVTVFAHAVQNGGTKTARHDIARQDMQVEYCE